jgi:hypothetical protein
VVSYSRSIYCYIVAARVLNALTLCECSLSPPSEIRCAVLDLADRLQLVLRK